MKKPLPGGSGFSAFGQKKRGRKEVLLLKGAAHGFRILSAYTIKDEFEQPVTQV